MEMFIYSRNQCVQCDATDRELVKILIAALAESGVELDWKSVTSVIKDGGEIVKPLPQNEQLVLVEVNLTKDHAADEAIDDAKEQHEILGAPYVVVDGDNNWTGFNIKKLQDLKANVAAVMPKMKAGSKPIVINIYKGTALAQLRPKPSLIAV